MTHFLIRRLEAGTETSTHNGERPDEDLGRRQPPAILGESSGKNNTKHGQHHLGLLASGTGQKMNFCCLSHQHVVLCYDCFTELIHQNFAHSARLSIP